MTFYERFRGSEVWKDLGNGIQGLTSRYLSVELKKNAGQNEVIIDSRIFIITSVKLSDETSDKCLTFIHQP